MVLASSADNQTRNYNTECLNHHPSLSTPRSKGLSHNKMKWWATYTNLPVNAIVRLPHLRTGGRYGQKMVLATSANNQIRNYNTECSNHHPSLSTPRSKGLSRSKMKWWSIYTNLPVNAVVRLPDRQSGDRQGQKIFLAPSADKQTCNYEKRVLKPPSLFISPKVKGVDP